MCSCSLHATSCRSFDCSGTRKKTSAKPTLSDKPPNLNQKLQSGVTALLINDTRSHSQRKWGTESLLNLGSSFITSARRAVAACWGLHLPLFKSPALFRKRPFYLHTQQWSLAAAVSCNCSFYFIIYLWQAKKSYPNADFKIEKCLFQFL